MMCIGRDLFEGSTSGGARYVGAVLHLLYELEVQSYAIHIIDVHVPRVSPCHGIGSRRVILVALEGWMVCQTGWCC